MSRAEPDAVLDEIEQMYRTRYSVFLRVATAIVGDADLARDAVHDGFVRAVRHRRRFRGESLEGWLWRIVVNAARRRRSDRFWPRQSPLQEAEPSSDAAERRSARARRRTARAAAARALPPLLRRPRLSRRSRMRSALRRGRWPRASIKRTRRSGAPWRRSNERSSGPSTSSFPSQVEGDWERVLADAQRDRSRHFRALGLDLPLLARRASWRSLALAWPFAKRVVRPRCSTERSPRSATAR